MASLASVLTGMFEFMITALDTFPGLFKPNTEAAVLVEPGIKCDLNGLECIRIKFTGRGISGVRM